MHFELPLGAFIAATIVLIPLPWHWRARNVPTLSIIGWLFLSNLTFGINSIIWADNVLDVATIWCDIVTKLQIGANLGLPMCCLCLCIHLERIASVREARTTFEQKRWRMVFDLSMCWGLPMIYMALHYVVQGHRFDIVQYFGCRPSTYVSLPAVFLVWVPPLTAAVLTFIYASIALHHFFRRRIIFTRHLQNSNSGLTASRYFRLMAMAVVQMFWTIIVTSLNMWFTCRSGLRPWTGWADVHYNFSRIGMFPALLIPEFALRWTFILWWMLPATSVIFVAFFAFGHDAAREYRACVSWIKGTIFRTKASQSIKLDLPSPSFPHPPSIPKFNAYSATPNPFIENKVDLPFSQSPTASYDPSSFRSSTSSLPTSTSSVPSPKRSSVEV
ncbi:hypothetical protein CCMSSC00406_0008483 [Pleurotus cornucopiae]|uniref:Uncharacterized protein n=1 Tax=Pleurotus cornucopiae TaxID=5321 RepID=A0ACB7II32_PLECO|nr:hypothetical protein CCMSSC00406_0008483 [Pleurotus cornucopiae]